MKISVVSDFFGVAQSIFYICVRHTENVDFHLVNDNFLVHFDVHDEWSVSALESLAVFLFAVA